MPALLLDDDCALRAALGSLPDFRFETWRDGVDQHRRSLASFLESENVRTGFDALSHGSALELIHFGSHGLLRFSDFQVTL
jgi:hypothetical protein